MFFFYHKVCADGFLHAAAEMKLSRVEIYLQHYKNKDEEFLHNIETPNEIRVPLCEPEYCFPSTNKSSMCFFLYQNPVQIHQLPSRATCPANRDFVTRVIFVQKYKLWSAWLCNYHQSPVTSISLHPNTSLCTLLSNTLSQCFSCNMKHNVSRPYKEQHKSHFTALHIIQIAFC